MADPGHSCRCKGERLGRLFKNYLPDLKPKTVHEMVQEFFRSFER